MASSSSINIPSAQTIFPFKTTSASKQDYLYEIEYAPAHVPATTFPILNPYKVFELNKESFSVKSIKKLFSAKTPTVFEECVQSSSCAQNEIYSGPQETFVPLEFPTGLHLQWLQDGYTHIHIGATKITRTFHGRHGQEVTGNLAILDTRYLTYNQAVIGTAQITMNAGAVFLTLYPNYNIHLRDPFLFKSLVTQVQFCGLNVQHGAIAATLHYQMAYRLQNHAINLPVPGLHNSPDALLMKIGPQGVQCTYVPKELTDDQLQAILPKQWTTAYEQHLQQTKTVVTLLFSGSRWHCCYTVPARQRRSYLFPSPQSPPHTRSSSSAVEC